MTPNAATLAALACTEDAQAALRKRLARIPRSQLAARPASGDWSPLEHVRHLVFAEQHHFAAYLERGFRWANAGVPPPNRTGERRLSPVGSDPATAIADIFDAWAKVHAVVRQLCLEARRDLTRDLEADLKHVLIHTAAIERLLKQ